MKTDHQQEIQRLQTAADQKRTELEASIAKAEEHQRRLSGLQRRVDDAADALIRADSQLAQLQGAVTSIEAGMLTAWGQTAHAVDGTATRPPDYSALVNIRAAIDDYPRCRKQLEANLATAQAALTDFENSK